MIILYYSKNYLLQLQIVMDFWAVYFSFIQGCDFSLFAIIFYNSYTPINKEKCVDH